MLLILAPVLAGCEYLIPSFAGHGGGGMKEYAEISISVADMNVSLPFYQRIGFDVIKEDQKPHRRVILSDGQIFIRLEQKPFDSPRFVYISSEAADRAERLGYAGAPIREYPSPDRGTAKEVKDPSGISIVLRHGRHPARTTGMINPQLYLFGEVSIETNDIPGTVEFWRKLGFEKYPLLHDYGPYVLLRDQAMYIGLHPTTSSRRVMITYFCPHIDSCMAGLKAQGVGFETEEKDENGKILSVLLKTPDGEIIRLHRGFGPIGLGLLSCMACGDDW